jgi:outer membrane protein assembly factor BamE
MLCPIFLRNFLMRSVTTIVATVLIASGLTACGTHAYYPFLYRAPVTQGNIINPTAFAELKPGMNRAEVVNIVGEPILQTPLSPNVWHYVYTNRVNNKVIQQQQITLYFNGDVLQQVVM